MAATLVRDAFGKAGNDLYALLGVGKDAEPSQIRRGYHRSALKLHPDKNPGDSAATLKFQALGAVHRILSDATRRKEYDRTGRCPEEDESEGHFGEDRWREYFSKAFHTVTCDSINTFAEHYVGSEEERQDVLGAYTKGGGDLGAVLDSVLLCTEADAPRFEAIVEAAIAASEVPRLPRLARSAGNSRTAKKRKCKADGEAAQAEKARAALGQRAIGGDLGDLAAAIQARKQAREAAAGEGGFLAQLEQKYAATSCRARTSGKDVKKRPAVAR
ncbi:unnamed protein product [Polarella glacialis]|uniref:J domain-containing protein n=1 Tax=Polarella glacialis TaxID=89957 RepID=A0A813JLZ2_POLGL|nr:unnamed protein product [Polarella glacialis]